MRRLRSGLLAACGMLIASCSDTAEPRAQWTIAIVTDAVIPQFGDRLLVEILDAEGNTCAECRRPIPIDERTVWPVELGVTPPLSGTAPRVRVRLHRSAVIGADGLPAGAALIDAVGVLPPAVGVTRVGIALAMDCFGIPSDPSQRTTCSPSTQALVAEPALAEANEALRALRPGDWARGKPVACPRAAAEDMVCLPGGAFLLGNARLIGTSDRSKANPEHLVVVSPFELDRDEVTVGAVRALLLAGTIDDEGIFGRTDTDPCTFVSRSMPTNDALPVTCVTHDFAKKACAAFGKRLPTEAEWEYAAGSTTRELTYPWGDAIADGCARAIVGRARSPSENAQLLDLSTGCRVRDGAPVVTWGVVAGGAPEDVTAEGVRNMGGNVSEWVLDTFQSYAEPCWATAGSRLEDPICRSDSTARSLRGASWADVPHNAASSARQGYPRTLAGANAGFRCARSF